MPISTVNYYIIHIFPVVPLRAGKWSGFRNGNRLFYMKEIKDELGMPMGFRLKGRWIRCFHFGQVRGLERERAEVERKGDYPDDEEIRKRGDQARERVKRKEERRQEWLRAVAQRCTTSDGSGIAQDGVEPGPAGGRPLEGVLNVK